MNNRRNFLVVLGAGVLVAMSFLGYLIQSGYEQQIRIAETTTRNYAAILEARLDATIRRAEADLQLLARTIPVAALNPQAVPRYARELNAELASKLINFPELAGVRVFSADGDRLYATDSANSSPTQISERGYFRLLRDNPGADLVFSEVIISRTTGRRSMPIAKAIRDGQGAFHGAVSATLEIDYFERLFAMLNVGGKGNVAIYRSDDFTRVMRWPAADDKLNARLPPDSPTRTALASGNRTATVEITSAADGVVRIYSYHVLHPYPFFVSVGVAKEETLADWRMRSLAVGLSSLLLLGLLAGMLYRLWRADAAMGKTARQLEIALERAQISEKRFRDLYDSTDGIVWEADPGTLEISYVSANAGRLLGYPIADWLRPGFCASHILAEDRERTVQFWRDCSARMEAQRIEFRFIAQDGRQVWLHNIVKVVAEVGKSCWLRGLMVDVTERKRADEKLRESEDRYRDLVEHSQDLICTHDLDGRILSVNPWAAKVLGYEQAELVNMNLRDILGSGVKHEADGYLAAIRTHGAAQGLMLVQPRAGEKRVWEYHNTLRTEGVPTPIVRGMAHDITELKRVERELRRKTEMAQLLEQLARAVNEAESPEMAMEICLRRICEHGKWALGRVATFSPDQGQPPRKAQHSLWFCPEPARFDAFMRHSEGYEFMSGSNVFINPVLRDQRPVWLPNLTAIDKSRLSRLKMAVEAGLKMGFAFPVIVEGEVAAFLEFFATETRQPDALLIEGTTGLASQFARMIERSRADEARARLAAIAESSNDAIIGRALDGRITSWNAAAERMLGYTAAEVIGRDLVEIFPPELRQEIAERRNLLCQGKGLPEYETVRLTKDGRRIDVSAGLSAVRDASRGIVGTAGILRDITERKQAENALRASHEQMRVLAARLNTAREQESALLAREIHDELGQAVTGLKLDLAWLASRLGREQGALGKKIGAMLSNADATIASIRNIASRLRPKMLDDLGLVAAIESQARDFRERAGVKCEVASSLRRVELDPEQSLAAFRITQESLTNIARHSSATRVDISLHEASGDLILEVRDNGRGIRADEIEARNSIGLLGMRERAMAAGGHFTITGFPGRGTVVTLRMPIPKR